MADASATTVAVTGGTGQLGRALLGRLSEAGYRTVSLARSKPDESGADGFVRADCTDPGDVFGALTRIDPDAVVHFGMLPTPENDPGHAVYESNAQSAYNVLEAAAGLGIEDVVLASSLCAKGAGFEQREVPVDYLPLDEAHPLRPSTAYGLGKEALERVADGFARREGPPSAIVSLRFPWVTTREDQRETFLGPERTLDALREKDLYRSVRNQLFSYVDVDDAMRCARRAIEADVPGHEAVYPVAADTTMDTPTPDLIEACYPDATVRRDFEGHESLFDASKARDLLDWTPRNSWRDLA